VAEYEQERVVAEEEAKQRAAAFVEEKRQAAATRIQAYEDQRRENMIKMREQIDRKEKAVQEEYEQHLEHDLIIEQQQRERMSIPYRAHEKERQREAEAPREVRRVMQQRDRRLRAQYQADEDAVNENRRDLGREHQEYLNENREKRDEVVRRVEIAAKERHNRVEEAARRVKEYNAKVATLQARRALRNTRLRAEWESFQGTQSKMLDAVYHSSVSGEIMDDSRLEQVIAAPTKKQGRRAD